MSSNNRELYIIVEKELGKSLDGEGRRYVDMLVNEKDITPREIADLMRKNAKREKYMSLLLVGAIGVAVLLGPKGCEFYNENYSETARILHAAAQEREPLKARQIILEAAEDKCRALWKFGRCPAKEWSNAASAYFEKAVIAGNTSAIRELYDPDNWHDLELKNKMRSAVLEKAKTSNDPDLLAAAAAIYRDDKLNVINSELESHYLYKAWLAGDEVSASRLSEIYMTQEQYDRAYLWSLRCIQECMRSDAISLSRLAQKVSPDVRTRMQALAQEKE